MFSHCSSKRKPINKAVGVDGGEGQDEESNMLADKSSDPNEAIFVRMNW